MSAAIPIYDVEYEHPLPGNTCDTKRAWARVPVEPTYVERVRLKDKIKRLLKERNAVMVSHYYVQVHESALSSPSDVRLAARGRLRQSPCVDAVLFSFGPLFDALAGAG